MPNRSQFVLQALAIPTRRFPLPCSVEEQSACFVVPDHNGQALACVYFEDAPGRRSTAELLSKDEADDCGVYLRETQETKGGIVMTKTLAKLMFGIAVLAAATGFGSSPTRAYGDAPWCAVIGLGKGDVYWDCQYPTFEACYHLGNILAGNRGFCNLNPRPGPSQVIPYKHRKRHPQY
jgi:hypothetical protein